LLRLAIEVNDERRQALAEHRQRDTGQEVRHG
jgi:hypothetical protein